MKGKVFLVFIILFQVQSVLAQKKLTIIIADIPGVFNKSYGGLEQRIIRVVTKCAGWSVKFVPVPFGRHTDLFKKSIEGKKYDGVATVPNGIDLKSYKAKSHIDFLNGFSVLQNKKIKINNFEDLAGLKVVSFVGAKSMYPKLKEMIPKMKSYMEISTQKSHNLMLYSNRIDAVFSDGLIFALDAKRIKKKRESFKQIKTSFYAITNPYPFNIHFISKENRNKFNFCFDKHSDEISVIKKEYLINLML